MYQLLDVETRPMTDVGRNEPCPCGSGRKYKRCCGRGGGDPARLPAFRKIDAERALDFVLEMTGSSMFARTHEFAQYDYYKSAFKRFPKAQMLKALEHEQTSVAFEFWLAFDAYITEDQHRLSEVLLGGDLRKQFTDPQLRFLERMAVSHMRPYEIREVVLDQVFTVVDLWNDAAVNVSERSGTHYLHPGDTLFARVIEGGRGDLEFYGAVLPIHPVHMHDVVRFLKASFRAKRRKRPDLDEPTFFKEAGPRIFEAWAERFAIPTFTTTDGEPLRPQTLVFDIVDREALDRALRQTEDFEWDANAREYAWFSVRSKVKGLERTLLATLAPEGERLRAHVFSDERAAKLRERLDGLAPTALRYCLTELQQLPSVDSPAPSLGAGSGKGIFAGAGSSGLPPEIEAQVMSQLMQTYYRGWLDEEIPALGGRTPRAAARLKTQRPKVAALLRGIERDAPGQHIGDITWMWEELDLLALRG